MIPADRVAAEIAQLLDEGAAAKRPKKSPEFIIEAGAAA
jgi:hypothetical protein